MAEFEPPATRRNCTGGSQSRRPGNGRPCLASKELISKETKPMTSRRSFLNKGSHLCAAAIAGSAFGAAQADPGATDGQRFLLIDLVGSENPTRANFPFVWAAALREAGHDVRIELAGDATVLMRTAVSNSVTPVGWPPFSQALAKVVELKIPIFV